MTDFFKPDEASKEWYATKYDDCILHATGVPYKFKAGSGRSEVLNRFGEDGRTIGEISRMAAEAGFDPNFTISAILKQHDTEGGAWKVLAPEGKTLEMIKNERQERRISPEHEAKRAEMLAAREAAAQEKMAKKLEADQLKAAKVEEARLARQAERDAAKAAREAAKADAPKIDRKVKEKMEPLADENPGPGKKTARTRKPKATSEVEEAAF